MDPSTTTGRPPRPHRPGMALLLALGVIGPAARAAPPVPPGRPAAVVDPFARFDLPDDWEQKFWADPDLKALFGPDLDAVAALVPTQAGVRFCRCPACDAPEADDPLVWSVARPKELKCRRCGVVVPNEKYPKADDKKNVPEDSVEVLPGVTHTYPYHAVEPGRQQYPDERLYLAARRDDAAREFLAKAALYAAVRYHEQPPGRKDPALARVAAVLVLRFAQVYPAYAAHFDQPSSPKYFEQANLAPPYRQGYRTGKWCWSGSRDVPLNLLVAYALLRDDPALREAGRVLKEPDPRRAIEEGLFRASARFVRLQPEAFTEASLQADRGILAVGRLLNDPVLVHDAVSRLERFGERGFAYDGFWGRGSLRAHRRVLNQLDGWFDRLLAGYSDPPGPAPVSGGRRLDAVAGIGTLPALALARVAGSVPLTEAGAGEVRLAGWPAPADRGPARAPMLLGGTGLARLALGSGANALDVELRGLDVPARDRIQRQALRLAVGGHTVLGDLDETAGTATGFDRATVSRNTVAVDGLNQRESLAQAGEHVPSGNFLFFAADPDFQVVTLDDPAAYPQSTTRYRQTVVAAAGPRSRFALGVFEVEGGLQHDQFFHGPAGVPARWGVSEALGPGPDSLLPPGLAFVPGALPEDGRWFVQAPGEFTALGRATVRRPALAALTLPGPTSTDAEGAAGTGVRLHLMGDLPVSAIPAVGPDPLAAGHDEASEPAGRAALILRRRSLDGATLRTTFVTLFEPVSPAIPPLSRVTRLAARGDVVAVLVESVDGPVTLVVNLTPGKAVSARLADNRTLTTDGLAVKVSAGGLVLAGGSFAACAGVEARQAPAHGRIVGSVRRHAGDSRGWFEADTPLPDPQGLAGRVLTIRHGDGTTRSWTLARVENTANRARLLVREEPGFRIDTPGGPAAYEHYPPSTFHGPHVFRVSRLARGTRAAPR